MRLKILNTIHLNKLIWFTILVFTTLFLYAQEINEEEDERIKELSPLALEMLELRVDELIKKKLEDCKLNAIRDAEIYVDSLIIKEAIENRIGVDGVPIKPTRPSVPDVILEADSMDVGPLFEEEEIEQSIN